MNSKFFDYIVVGLSISGVAAATELASHGHSVCVLDHLLDGTSLSGTALIFPTPLNCEKLEGEEFEKIVLQKLHESNVLVIRDMFVDFISIRKCQDKNLLYFLEERTSKNLLTTSAIFAPNGTEIGLPVGSVNYQFLGKGVSYCAWSDGLFFAKKPVIVVGCGHRALEQSYWAAKWASSVSLICENGALEASSPWLEIISGSKIIKIRLGVQLNAIKSDNAGNVKSIILLEKGREYEEETSAVFVARGLVCNWSIWGGKQEIKSYIDKKMLYVCGLANGCDYSNHIDLYEDGVRVAKECLRL